MAKFLKSTDLSPEQIAHDIVISVLHSGTEGYMQGNAYQVSDQAIAKYAFGMYEDCYPMILEMVKNSYSED